MATFRGGDTFWKTSQDTGEGKTIVGDSVNQREQKKHF